MVVVACTLGFPQFLRWGVGVFSEVNASVGVRARGMHGTDVVWVADQEETAIARAGVWAWRGGLGFGLGLVFRRTEVLVAIAFNIRGSDPHAKHTLY